MVVTCVVFHTLISLLKVSIPLKSSFMSVTRPVSHVLIAPYADVALGLSVDQARTAISKALLSAGWKPCANPIEDNTAAAMAITFTTPPITTFSYHQGLRCAPHVYRIATGSVA
jgi:hypothetical protein